MSNKANLNIVKYETPKEPVRLKRGEVLVIDDEAYILARVGDETLQLINLQSGNRWDEGTPVMDMARLVEYGFTQEEFVRAFDLDNRAFVESWYKPESVEIKLVGEEV